MHVLLSYPGYKPAYRMGGPIVVLAAVAEELVRKGHRVSVVTTNANLDEDLDVPVNGVVNVEGVEVWYLKRYEFLKRWLPFIPFLAKSNGYFFAPEMNKTLRQLMPSVDVVHVQSPFSYTNLAASRAAFGSGVPLVYQQHGILDPKRLQFRGLKKRVYVDFVERPIMKRAAALIALTESEVESYRRLGIDTECHRVANGVDVSQYRACPRRVSYPGWSVGDGSVLVLFLGRLHPMKGVEKLLSAFGKMHAQFPEATLVMAGPDEVGLVARLKAEVAAAGLEKKVFFPGMVSGDEKLDLLARADVFCLPSEAEGFSLAVLEALASSTAVLLSPGCHFPEVKSAGAGEIVAAEPHALATALATLLTDRSQLNLMGKKGRKFVEVEYTWEHVTSQLLEIYGRVITRSR